MAIIQQHPANLGPRRKAKLETMNEPLSVNGPSHLRDIVYRVNQVENDLKANIELAHHISIKRNHHIPDDDM